MINSLCIPLHTLHISTRFGLVAVFVFLINWWWWWWWKSKIDSRTT